MLIFCASLITLLAPHMHIDYDSFFYHEEEAPEPLSVRLHPIVEKDFNILSSKARDIATFSFYSQLTQSREIASLVLEAAVEHNIQDVEILFALMWVESRFQPNAVNVNTTSLDRGLFQLNSLTYAAYPTRYFFDIEWNIRTGVQHYATELAIVNGNHQYALHAYNAGRARRFHPPPHTRVYANRVLQVAEEFHAQKLEYITQTRLRHMLALL